MFTHDSVRDFPSRHLPTAAWEGIEQAVERFERAWAGRGEGPPPEIEPFLAGAGAARPARLLELVHADLELRLDAGYPVRVEDYLDRYPELAADRDAVVSLVTAEDRLRRELGHEVTPEEYARRFPELAASLRRRWRGGGPADGPGSYHPSTAPTTDGQGVVSPHGPAPIVVPGYEIVGWLGGGAMGDVYRARNTRTKRDVALKVIRHGREGDPKQRVRFQIEAEALARLQHPNVVQLYEVGEHDHRPYLAMELVPGGTLAQALKGRPLPPRFAAELAALIARGVHAAHLRGVVHRDLKPANILLRLDGRPPGADPGSGTSLPWPGTDDTVTPKVTDFGLARLDQASIHTHSVVVPGTPRGAILGTAPYMSPEQARGDSGVVEPATDVYGLGAVLYELLVDRPPFDGATIFEILGRVLGKDPDPPRQVRPEIPRDLEVICLKCLRKDPARRYRSAEALAEDLTNFLTDRPITARPVGRPERAVKWVRRNPAAAGVAVLVAGLVVALAHTWLRAQDAWADARVREANERAARSEEARQQAEKRAAEEGRERVANTLARMLSRPLRDQDGPLQPAEVDALWVLATAEEDTVRSRFFELALDDWRTVERVGRRARWVVQAAVGLDPGRRDRLRALLVDRLRNAHTPPEVRRACLALALALAPAPELAAVACSTLLGIMAREVDPRALAWYVDLFRNFLPALGHDQAIASAGDVLPLITTALVRISGPTYSADDWEAPRRWFATAIHDTAAQGMPPGRAAEAADRLLAAVRTAAPQVVVDLVRALTALIPHLPADRAAPTAEEVARHLVAAAGTAAPYIPSDLPTLLVAATDRLPPDRGAALAGAMTDIVLTALIGRDPAASYHLCKMIEELVVRLDPGRARGYAARLTEVMAVGPGYRVPCVGRAVARLAGRSDDPAAAAGPVIELLLTELPQQVGGRRRAHPADYAGAIDSLAAWLPKARAEAVRAAVADHLLGIVSAWEAEGEAGESLLPALAVVVDRLPPNRAGSVAARAARVTLAAIPVVLASPNWSSLARVAQTLDRLAAHLPGPEAAAVTGQAIDYLLAPTTTGNPANFRELAVALRELVGRLPPERRAERVVVAGQAVDRVLAALDKGENESDFMMESYGSAVASFAAWLPRDRAADAAGRTAARLLRATAGTADEGRILLYLRPLGELAPWLGPDDADRAVRVALAAAIQDWPSAERDYAAVVRPWPRGWRSAAW